MYFGNHWSKYLLVLCRCSRSCHRAETQVVLFFYFLKGTIPLCMVNYLLNQYRRYTTYKISCVSQLVTLGYMFRPLPGHHQANKE